MRPDAPAECANCGTAIPPHARACPECGADETTGWRESDMYDGLDLPASAWSDDDATGAKSTQRRPIARGLAWYWWATGLFLTVGATLWVLGLL